MIELQKKDADIKNIKKPRDLSVAEVMIEARQNHNELVDAMLEIRTMLTGVKEALDDLKHHKDILDLTDSLNESIVFNAESIDAVTKTTLPALEQKMRNNMKDVKAALLVKVDENKDKIVLQEGHSRRLNIIIQGKVETAGENTEEVARSFLTEDLKMDAGDVGQFIVRDAHRLPKGKKRDGTEVDGPRPIIMAFIRQKDRNTVMRNAYQLKNTVYSLKSDLPKHLNELRSDMLKERLRLKDAHPGVKFRVTERSYKPVLQRENGVIPGSEGRIKWDTVKFPA